jgi:hypothetical protein
VGVRGVIGTDQTGGQVPDGWKLEACCNGMAVMIQVCPFRRNKPQNGKRNFGAGFWWVLAKVQGRRGGLRFGGESTEIWHSHRNDLRVANIWGAVFPDWRIRAFPGLKIEPLRQGQGRLWGTQIHQSAF